MTASRWSFARSGQPPAALLMAVALLAAGAVVGCSMLGPGASTPSPTASPTSMATATPTDDLEPTPESPPIASLSLPDGTEHAAQLGSSCYKESCADGPWLPAFSMSRIDLSSAADPLTMALPDGYEFTLWQARYAAAEDTQADVIYPLDGGGAEDDSDRFAQVSFDAPPSGEWVLEVFMRFTNEDGDATYYWYVAVP